MTRLAIDTSTQLTSVAWETADGHRSLTSSEGRASVRLAEMVAHALKELGGAAALECVVAGVGPGSFTALRMGISFAKGMCRAFDVPAIAVPSVEAATANVEESGAVLVVLDARKGELHGGLYGARASVLHPYCVSRVQPWLERFRPLADETGALITGDVANLAELFADVEPERFRPWGWCGGAAALLSHARAQGLRPVAAGGIEPLYLRPSDAEIAGPRPLKIPV